MNNFIRNTLAGILTLAALGTANAASVSLINGVADPLNIGSVPVPPNLPQSFSSSQIEAMTDNNTSTGFAFSSSLGEYSSNPNQVIGFGLRFDFDVSGYTNITEASFTWTGKFNWDGNTFPNLRFGAESSMVQTRMPFGSSSNSPDGQSQTATINFFEGGGAPRFSNLTDVLNGNLLSFWVTTDLGISCDNCVNSITMETLEVSANIEASPVPVPAAIWLFGSGLIALIGAARRKNNS
jgi:hypothetical protein